MTKRMNPTCMSRCASQEVFRNFSGTVWLKSSLWKMMGILLMIAVFVGLLVAMLLKDRSKYTSCNMFHSS